MSTLPADCLNEIFEYLEEDESTLYSCLLVNRLWCQVSVRILWRNIRNYNTLISCLPDESKEILYKNRITSTLTSKSPTFNYASFCKILSIDQVDCKIEQFLKNQRTISSQNLNDNMYILTREIFKFLTNQISSLRKLVFDSSLNIRNFTLDSSKNLAKFRCNSDIYPEFFHQLSKTCHNLISLKIAFEKVISNGLTDLISKQRNLKYLKLMQYYDSEDLTSIITSLKKLPNTLIKLNIYGERYIPFTFISKFTNLQEIILSFDNQKAFKDFKKLQYVNFPQLQVLKFQYEYPRYEFLIKFLEINGKNLKEFYITYSDNSLNLAIIKFCPNLRKFFTGFKKNELETLKEIFISCQYLESIKIRCCEEYLNEKELFEIIAKYSPKNIHELKLCYSYYVRSELLPEELESFFVSWTNRIPHKPLSFIIICNYSYCLDTNDENMNIIKKYINLGIIEKFKILYHYFDDFDDFSEE